MVATRARLPVGPPDRPVGPGNDRTRRRTQAERSATTRAALLDATLDCLAELGYAATTTNEIVGRAGLSRGAQVHHFPTKVELVGAAIERLFERSDLGFRSAFAALSPDDRTFDTAIDLLWSLFRGPTFVIWLELVVAARTDPELQAEVRSVTARFRDTVAGTFAELFPEAAQDPFTGLSVSFVFTALEGLALERTLGPDDPRAAEIVDLLQQLARFALPNLSSLQERP
jgi:AcrR family transcriptional regulator